MLNIPLYDRYKGYYLTFYDSYKDNCEYNGGVCGHTSHVLKTKTFPAE